MSALVADREGAVLVSSLFASAFVVGATWYLLGVGDALLAKERMQDGADAVAFTSSVVQARGMNIVVLVNLTMASLVAVLVAVKIVHTLHGVANALACAASPTSTDCHYLTKERAPHERFVDEVERSIMRTNRTLADASTAIGRGAPHLAARRAVEIGRAYRPMVEGSVAVSISSIAGETERGFGASLVDDAACGTRVRSGLPIEDDDYENLCHHSGTSRALVFVPTTRNYSGGARLVETIQRYTKGLVNALVNGDPSPFCGSSGPGERRPVSKRLYAPARMGNDYFATWGVASSSFNDVNRRGEEGVAVATLRGQDHHVATGLDDLLSRVQLAKSETFYAPRGGGPRGGRGYADEALWHPRWKARLRRFRLPTRSLGRLMSGPALSAVLADSDGDRRWSALFVGRVLAADPANLVAFCRDNVGPVGCELSTGGIDH